MENLGSNDDCYFYFYSSCTKGEDCPFRHCEAALGSEIVCSLWREGRCFRGNCKFRHMESRIKRSTIPCYWENQPGGCRKPHCVFLHQKFRSNIHTAENQKLIMPVSTQAAVPPTNSAVSDMIKESSKLTSGYMAVDPSLLTESITLSVPSQPVEPVVVSFDEGEESDAESVSSTPVKSAPSKASCGTAVNSAHYQESETKDFGIKTLEQLRMEKIHRESEHFYKPDDSDDKVIADKSLEVNRISSLHKDPNMFCFSDYPETQQMEMKSESIYSDFYPPDSSNNILPLSTNISHVEMTTSSSDAIQNDSSLSRDLRTRIKNRSSLTRPNIENEKRVLTLKRPRDQAEEDPLDFKIKTLDEIRREKESKQIRSPPPAYENIVSQQVVENNKELADVNNTAQQRKLRKLFRDPFTVHKEDREVQKALERNLRIDDALKTEKYGSFNGKKVCDEERFVCRKVYDEEKSDTGKIKEHITTLSEKHDEVKKTEIPRNETKTNSPNITEEKISNEITISTNGIINSPKKSQRPIIRRKNKLSEEPALSPIKVVEEEREHSSDSPALSIGVGSQEEISSSEQEPTITSSDDLPNSEVHTTVRSTSVDDFDHLFLNDDTEMTLDDAGDSDKKAEDIFLEIEQMLES